MSHPPTGKAPGPDRKPKPSAGAETTKTTPRKPRQSRKPGKAAADVPQSSSLNPTAPAATTTESRKAPPSSRPRKNAKAATRPGATAQGPADGNPVESTTSQSTRAPKGKDRKPKPPKGKPAAKGKADSPLVANDKPVRPSPSNRTTATPVVGGGISSSGNSKPRPAKSARESRRPKPPPLKLKVVIRRLPPTLPEAVFWRAVAPFVKFPIPEDSTTTTDVTIDPNQFPPNSRPEVAGASKVEATTTTTTSAGGATDGAKTTTPENPESAGLATKDASVENHAEITSAEGNADAPKEVIKRLVRYYPNSGSAMTDGYYRWYFPGKVPKNRSKQPVFSRAYIRFNSMEEVVQFHQNFNGHVFVDGQGQQTAALVEFAPNQLLPSASRFRDNKAGAIERDSDYLAFVQSLTQPRAANPPDSESPTQAGALTAATASAMADGKPKSYLNAATSAASPTPASASNPSTQSTHLLDFLRQKKKAASSRLASATTRRAGILSISAQQLESHKPRSKASARLRATAKSQGSPASTSGSNSRQAEKAARKEARRLARENKPKVKKEKKSKVGGPGATTSSKSATPLNLHSLVEESEIRAKKQKKRNQGGGGGDQVKG
ncbi:hypothetical protein H4R33_002260 [Dimargaris cristalligena]|nr:hypothetical protein H4R33_002260 [Dimargaris cristalligena]